MSFKYSCFISYCRSGNKFMNTFIQQLTETLEDYLDPYLNEKVYIDTQLEPGCRYPEELARAICRSICMIVVYTPKYTDAENHPYCLREYRAMELIEKKRKQLLEDKTKNTGIIIPIIFRGEKEDLPCDIGDYIHYCDFSQFTTASPHIEQNPEYIDEIQKIVKIVYGKYKLYKQNGIDPCCDCESFSLPSEEEVKPWKIKLNKSSTPFQRPGR